MAARKKRVKRRNGSFAFRDFDTHDVRIIIHAPFSAKYGKPMIWQRVLTINDYEKLWRHAGGMPWLSDAVRLLKHAAQKELEKGGPWGDMPRCSSVGIYVNSMLFGDEDYVLRDLDGSLFLDEPGTLKVDLEGGCAERRNPDDSLRRLERAASSGNNSGHNYDNVAAYWLALLRSGQLPKPPFDYGAWKGWAIWIWIGNATDRLWQINLQKNIVEVYDVIEDTRTVKEYVASSKEAALAKVKEELAKLLHKYDDPDVRRTAAAIKATWNMHYEG